MESGFLLPDSLLPIPYSLVFNVRPDRHVQTILEQALEAFAHGLRVAAAKAEAVALDGGDKGIDGAELGSGRLGAHLTQVGPGVNQFAIFRSLDDNRKALLAVGRHGGGPRLVRRGLGD